MQLNTGNWQYHFIVCTCSHEKCNGTKHMFLATPDIQVLENVGISIVFMFLIIYFVCINMTPLQSGFLEGKSSNLTKINSLAM